MTLIDSVQACYREQCSGVLETERMVLRAPRFKDVKAVAALVNDRRIAENTARIPHPYRVADAREWIEVSAERRDAMFLITRQDDAKHDGEILGACGLDMTDPPAPELGYWLGVAHWGHGYATEAVRALIDHAFEDLACEALVAGARVSNPESRRVLAKCGFQWTGVGLYRIRAIASSAPVDRFRLDRGIWASLRRWRPRRGA